MDHEFFRRLLEERKAALLNEQNDRASDTKPVELDQTRVGRLSRMDELQQQAMSQAMSRRAQEELRRIDAALERIAEEEYGACVICGELIAEKRLKAYPAIEICIDCAEAVENRR